MKTPLFSFLFVALCCVVVIPELHAAGGPGYALRFDGIDDHVQVGASSSFPAVTNTFTIELWVNPTATHGETGETNDGISGFGLQRFAVFPDHGDNVYGAGNAGAGLSIGANGISVFEHGANYLPSLLVYSNAVSGWTHVALVYLNRQPQLYVNGALMRSGVTSMKTNVHASASLGGLVGYGNYQGDLDEVRIWKVARSQTQIRASMNRSLTGVEPNLVAYYRCDEGSGTTLEDGAPADPNHSGELTNGVVFVPSGVHPFTPSVETLPADFVGPTMASLNLIANPGGTNTSGWFEWGQTTNYGNVTAAQALGSGTGQVNLSQGIVGLIPGVSHHFRAVASNSFGVVFGGDQSFTTPVFTDINAGLPGVSYSSAAWGDYDNDGDLDILLTGASTNAVPIARIYRNNGSSTFTDIDAGLPGVSRGSAAWGDYDNDGDLDILLIESGFSLIYRNNGNDMFTRIDAGLSAVSGSSAAWGDYDNDGKPGHPPDGTTPNFRRLSHSPNLSQQRQRHVHRHQH